MTGFEIYLLIIWVLGLAVTLYYAGKGGVFHSTGVLLFSALWIVLNIFLLLTIGIGG